MGYEVILVFICLQSDELAIERVKLRVSEGGHNIPPDVVIRRYKRGLMNLKMLYLNIVDRWFVIDNSIRYKLIAEGSGSHESIHDPIQWSKLTIFEQ